MAEQYQEGEVLKGSDGKTYIVVGGVPREQVSAPAIEGGVYRLPTSPQKAAEEARKERGAEIAESAEQRAVGGEQRDITKQITDLQKDYRGYDSYKKYTAAVGLYNAGLNTQPNTAGDLELITYAAKMRDPTTGVLGGEAEQTKKIETYVNQIKAEVAKQFGWEEGGTLTPEGREFLRTNLRNAFENNFRPLYLQDREYFTQQALASGIDPVRIVGPDPYDAYKESIEGYWRPKTQPTGIPAAAGGPVVSVTPEESARIFGEFTGGKPAYDAQGNVVGFAYAEAGNPIYDENGNQLDVGLFGRVTEEVRQQPAPSFFGGIAQDVGEAITGSERETATTENLPDWVNMPELNQLLSIPAWKTALGTVFGGGPQEIAQIVQANFPGTKIYQDQKGNYIIESPSTGQRYAIKPGFQLSDVPRLAGTVALGAAGGGAGTVARTAGREAALQAGVEATQLATGGTFNPEDVAASAALGAAGQKIADIVPPAVQRIRGLRDGGGPTPPTPPAGGAPMTPTGGAPIAPGEMRIRRGSEITEGAAPTTLTEIAPAAPTMGTRSSAGAMSVSEETIRAQRAAELPIPIELARFQRTRNFVEQQRARELAKNNEVGGPIRERMAQQQEALRQNFERFIEGTGSQVWENPYEQGGVISNALATLAKRERTKINALYKRADAAGETAEPVSYQNVIAFINEQTPTTRERLAPVLTAVQEAIVKNDPTGSGVITLKQMEDVRKLINRVAQPGTPDAAYGRQLKGLIDASTEGAGGDIYKRARDARIKYAQDFENIDLVQKIFENKPGTADRYVALEKVTDRITGTTTPLDSVNHLIGLLDRAGPRGERAKRELQGALMEKIRDQAYRGITRDESGGTVIQPAALNRIISDLDKTGKLDAIFDKKTAELLRTVNDVTKDIVTAPPGSVNASGTSSAIMNAIDTVATFGTTGIPVPAAKILNEFRKALANRQLRKEVKRLLD